MDCPKCGGKVYCKGGIVQGRQRYLGKGCRYRYTVEQRAGPGDKATKRQALELYLEGLGVRSMGRILKFSHVSILNGVKAFGEALPEIKREEPVQVMEMEMDNGLTVWAQKKLWLDRPVAVDRDEKRVIDCVWGQGNYHGRKALGIGRVPGTRGRHDGLLETVGRICSRRTARSVESGTLYC